MLRIGDESRKWWVLSAAGVVGGLILLDETVVGVALPTMQRDLGMSQIASHWVISAYLLVFTGFAAAGGKMGDVVGFKAMYVAGLAVFGLASVASGFAESGAWLIAARAVQGLGAAAIFPLSVAMVTLAFPKEQRGMALGLVATIGTTFLTAGPLVGGFLTELVSWRWIFWINAPLVALSALTVMAVWVDPPRDGARPGIDFGGLVTLVAGLGLLIFAIMQGAAWGWTHPAVLAAFGCGVILLIVFVLIERRRDAPLIDVELFRSPTFSAYSLVVFAGQFSKMTIVVFGALYLQREIGMSPFMAGLCLLAGVVGTPIMAAPTGRITDRIGSRRPTLAGLALATLGMSWIGLAADRDSLVLLLPGLVVWGFAVLFCYLPPARAIMNAVAAEKQGQASGLFMTTRLLGGTVGMAACGALYATTGDFRDVFLATACLMLAALVVGWFAIDRRSDRPAP